VGELEFTFRGVKQTVRSGETINIPANAPHWFRNSSAAPARLLCTCSPAGQEEFFMKVGVPRRDSHNASTHARRGRRSRIQGKGRSASPKLSD
jgi:uncharacterized cupin superfamily protein